MTGGIAFVNPASPGVYPAGLQANATAGTQAKEEAIHKELIAQYEIFKGVKQGLKDIIQEAVEMDYLLEIKDETLGFLNQTPGQMIEHLRNRGGALDFADTKTLLSERDTEWNMSEVPQLYFNRVEKVMRGLTRAGINSDLNKRRNMALFISKQLVNLMPPSVNGKQNLQRTKHGLTSKTSSQLSMQKRTNKTNSQQNNSRQIQSKNKLR